MHSSGKLDSYSPNIIYANRLNKPSDISLGIVAFEQCKIHDNLYPLLIDAFKNEPDIENICDRANQLYNRIFVLLGYNEGPYPPPDLTIDQLFNLIPNNDNAMSAHEDYFNEITGLLTKVISRDIQTYNFYNRKIDETFIRNFFVRMVLVKNSTIPHSIYQQSYINYHNRLEQLELFLMFEFGTPIQLISPDLESKEYFGHFFDATNSSIRFCGNTFHVSLPFELKESQAIYKTSNGNLSLDFEKNGKSKTSNGHIVTLTKEDGTTEKFYEKDLYCSATNNYRSEVIKGRKLYFIDKSLYDHFIPSTITSKTHDALLVQQSGNVPGDNYFGLFLEYLSKGTNVSFDYYKTNYINRAGPLKKKVLRKHIKSITQLPPEDIESILDDFEEIFCQYDFVKHVNEAHELFSYIMLKNIGFIPTFQCYKSMLDHRIKVIIKDVQSAGIVMGSNFTFPEKAKETKFQNFMSLISLFELRIIHYLYRIDDFHQGNLAYTIKQYNNVQYIENVKVIDLWPSYDILSTYELYPILTDTTDSIMRITNQYLLSKNFDIDIQGFDFPDLNIKGINTDFAFILNSQNLSLKQYFLVFISFSRVITKIYKFVLENIKDDKLNGRDYHVSEQTDKVLTQFIELSKRDLAVCKNISFSPENIEQIVFLQTKSILASQLLIFDLHQKLYIENHKDLLCMNLFLFRKSNPKDPYDNSLTFKRHFNFHKIKRDFKTVSLFLLTQKSYDSLFKDYASTQSREYRKSIKAVDLLNKVLPSTPTPYAYFATNSPVLFDIFSLELVEQFEPCRREVIFKENDFCYSILTFKIT